MQMADLAVCGGLHTNTHDVGSRASIMRFMVGALAELLCADDDAEVCFGVCSVRRY